MGSRELVGVVTVTFNSSGVIDDFMVSMLNQGYSAFILYVVDNASSDDTLQGLSKYKDPRIVLIPNQTNVGVAEGNNTGIRAALRDSCGLILLINNDTVFEADLLQKLVEGLQKHRCEMIVPKILFFDKPDTIWCAGGYFSALRGTSGHFGFGKNVDDPRFDDSRAISYSPTCCMLIEHEVFDRIGLMDENYFVYHDDTDFCLRACRGGVRLFYLPSAQILHKVGSLTGLNSSFTIRFASRNHVYLILKHYSPLQVWFYCSGYYIFNLWKYMFLLRSPKSFWMAQRAFWEGISLFHSSLDQPDREIVPTGSK
jgi:GT2 family glycosyltransferase